MVDTMITTIDNPYDPFTQYDDWFAFDDSMKYYTPSLLDRVVVMSNDLSEPDQALAVQHAIDEIVKENVNGLYIKVTRDVISK